jgi:hypothetical protein
MTETYDVYGPDGEVNKDFLQSVLKNPEGLKNWEEVFQVVVCNKDIHSVYDRFNAEIKANPEIFRTHKTGEEILKSQRSDISYAKDYTAIVKALGLPATCDVPMSGLPTTPGIVAALSNPAKTRG